MDRTAELKGTLAVFAGAPVADLLQTAEDAATPPTDFSAAAATVAQRFAQTQRLIARLETLVDRRALHNDPAAEINEVSTMFAEDVKEIDQQISLLTAWAAKNAARRSQRWQHCDSVIGSLKSRAAGHTMRFQEALQKRTDVLKHQSRRRQKFGTAAPKGPMVQLNTPLFEAATAAPPPPPPAAPAAATAATAAGPPGRGVAHPHQPYRPHQPPQPHYQPEPPRAGGEATALGLRARRRQANMQTQQLLMEEEEDLVKHAHNRLDFAKGVEREIAKLGEVFAKFGALVLDQGETLRLIDQDIEEASMEVEDGHAHVSKTYQITKGNRSMIIKLFLLVIFFALVFTRL